MLCASSAGRTIIFNPTNTSSPYFAHHITHNNLNIHVAGQFDCPKFVGGVDIVYHNRLKSNERELRIEHQRYDSRDFWRHKHCGRGSRNIGDVQMPAA
jgi:hypothetical protein